MYREGFARFASEKYNNNDLGSEQAKFSHLTNYSINKTNVNYIQNEVIISNNLVCLECLKR